MYVGADFGQRPRQAGVVDPPTNQPAGNVVLQRQGRRRIVAHLETQVAVPPQIERREFYAEPAWQAVTEFRRNRNGLGPTADRKLRGVGIDPAGDFDAAKAVAGEHAFNLARVGRFQPRLLRRKRERRDCTGSLSLWEKGDCTGPLSLWERARVRAVQRWIVFSASICPHPRPLSRRERGV